METTNRKTNPAVMKFERKEMKYLTDESTAKRMIELVSDMTVRDERGSTGIYSLYYDDERFDLTNRSIEKPPYKEKFRLRSYGVPTDETVVFAEIKKKLDGITYKRRVSAPYSEILKLADERKLVGKNEITETEILRLLERRNLKPAIWIGYERIALVGRNDPNLRITFDFDGRFRTNELELSAGNDGTLIEDEGFCVMEIKSLQAVPLELARILSKERLWKGTYSKVGRAYSKVAESIRKG